MGPALIGYACSQEDGCLDGQSTSYLIVAETEKPDNWDEMTLDEQIQWLEGLEDPDFDDLELWESLVKVRKLYDS